MLSEIPLDILINILSFLPPSRSQKDSSGGTLAACLRVNSLFAEAARMPSLWKAHYEVRFEHCDETAESSRFSQSGDDWKQLYIERRRIDRQVQQCLASLVVNSPGRLRLCKEVVTYGMDVWDVLDLERTSSLSAQLFETDEDRNPGPVSIKTTARRYWAGYILDRISRRTAVLLWRRFWTPDVQQPSFEETMTHLSCFYGCSPKRVSSLLKIHFHRILIHSRTRLQPVLKISQLDAVKLYGVKVFNLQHQKLLPQTWLCYARRSWIS